MYIWLLNDYSIEGVKLWLMQTVSSTCAIHWQEKDSLHLIVVGLMDSLHLLAVSLV
jgi:hypothetical protein